ncbi:hypothetical protein BO70DRAFT_201119 [Aspergillus heteromorphus CBS 117.55]|uniref:Uncharacterized protein n=1 Tax=Aspergillus heteromorphus CBS 117.55 TaxID=1448321 RepID=A0A317WS27_9EURO|nr:uncharacterized protein BO70DRAFT_201119 [Aspergillus heteromorphus CBS 117.55]PWY87718.1 hypothetical protein BO70DRAFT_201119 [Aspergillus heteromorphus CBS 117.55]
MPIHVPMLYVWTHRDNPKSSSLSVISCNLKDMLVSGYPPLHGTRSVRDGSWI